MSRDALIGEVAGFRFARLGRTTLVIRGDAARFVPGSYRVLLARIEGALVRTRLAPEQAVFYLPELIGMNNPFDIGGAAASYAQRHPELKSVYVVAPKRGAITVVIDAFARALPSFDVRLFREVDEATRALRARDVELPLDWPERLPVFLPDPFETGR
ncbi:MAG: hypothetical protein IT374_23085 [Polyangiaceae bacterium]|nr:hypothetical protein [Polyangiaceae bacterium]